MRELVERLTALMESEMISWRRYIHEHPELSFKEENTAAFIRQKLEEFGVPMMSGIRGNSTVGVLCGEMRGPCVAFRADIDALPIQESNDLLFRSKTPKVMHACGHDAHTAILLALAKVLAQKRELIRGEVRFIFEQAEELIPGGARMLMEDGALNGVDHVFALHIRTNMDIGQVNIQPGARSAAIGSYEITITGRGGHSGFPHRAVDPITVAADVASSIYRIVPQRTDPQTASTLTVGYIHSDNKQSPNVICRSVTLGGSYRTTDNTLVEELLTWVKRTAQYICEANNCEMTMETVIGYPAVINRGEDYKFALRAAEKLGFENIESQDIMGGEDFSYILEEYPGAYFTIGTRDKDDPRTGGARHSCDLVLGERGMMTGLRMLLGTYLEVTENSEQ